MITLREIREEIFDTLSGDLTTSTLDKLYKLYIVCDHMHEADDIPAEPLGESYVTREFADEWVNAMQNEDGSVGAHWDFDQCKTILARRGYTHNPNEWYIVFNMMYSDYCKVAKHFGVNVVDFCTLLADAFLHDKDAAPDKLTAYYQNIVRH